MNKYKTPYNKWIVSELFFETARPDSLRNPDRMYTYYTLRDEPRPVGDKTYPSLYQLYLELEDTTEYEFANKYLGGWSHWLALLSTNWFPPYARRWREELELKLKVTAIKNIKTLAQEEGKNKLAANRYLLDSVWVKEDGNSVGRPSKKKIKEEAQKLVEHELELDEDYKRIFN